MTATNQTTLAVLGMTCPSCSRHVTMALKSLPGVDAVEVHVREKRVFVQHGAEVQAQQMVGALAEAGYEARAA
jgi:copper chaperone CopZ